MTDFNRPIDISKGQIKTEFLGKTLILKNIYFYEGPITLQLLPFGGVQSVYGGRIILHTKSGFIASDRVIYDSREMSSEEFIACYPDLVNEVLPN